MRRLDRYLFRAGAVPFLLILLCTTAVLWLTQVLQRVELMVEDGGSLTSFLAVTVLLVPSLVGVIAPFALLGAIVYAVNLLASDNELPVMSAAGVSRRQLGLPMVGLALLVTLLVVIVNVDLQPRSYRMMKTAVDQVRSDIAGAMIRSQVFSKVSRGVTVYAEEARPGDQYTGLLIHDERDPAAPVTYTAEKGLFQSTPFGPRLALVRGTIQRIDPETGDVDVLRFVETAIDLATFSAPSEGRRLEATERYLPELFDPDLADPYVIERADRFLAEGHSRIATTLYPLAFAMVALAILLTAPVSRRGHGQRIMMVIGAAIGLRVLGFIAQSAAGDTPALNIVQYAVPGAAILVGGLVVFGPPFKRPRRRRSLAAEAQPA